MDFRDFMIKHSYGYELLLLRYKDKKTYAEIAKSINAGKQSVRDRVRFFLRDLYKLYYRYLQRIGTEIDNRDICRFYMNDIYAIAYLEREYSSPLHTFRSNAPPLILPYVDRFPSYRKLSDRQHHNLEKKVADARKNTNKTFEAIGKELKLTGEKAHDIYNYHLHKKIALAIDRIEPTVDFDFETFIYCYFHIPKRRWEYIISEYPDLVQDLID